LDVQGAERRAQSAWGMARRAKAQSAWGMGHGAWRKEFGNKRQKDYLLDPGCALRTHSSAP